MTEKLLWLYFYRMAMNRTCGSSWLVAFLNRFPTPSTLTVIRHWPSFSYWTVWRHMTSCFRSNSSWILIWNKSLKLTVSGLLRHLFPEELEQAVKQIPRPSKAVNRCMWLRNLPVCDDGICRCMWWRNSPMHSMTELAGACDDGTRRCV